MTKKFGLLGKNIGYSFSRTYFSDKFKKENLEGYSYENFDTPSIADWQQTILTTPNLKGLNITIPYKEAVIPLLDELSKKAKTIGAVNCVKISKNKKTKGFNTDYYGFKKSLQPLLQPHHKKALILGTGGASKAIAFALQKMNIEYRFVSRQQIPNGLTYSELTTTVFSEYTIIINTTPLGTFPDIEAHPSIPYEYFSNQHIAYDLIYNPEETAFLKKAKNFGATTKNGYEMLVLQAEKAWKIWNKK